MVGFFLVLGPIPKYRLLGCGAMPFYIQTALDPGTKVVRV